MLRFASGALALAACVGDPVPTSLSHPASPKAPSVADVAPPAPVEKGPEVSADERAAYDRARPVLDRHCGRCHIQGGAQAKDEILAHVDMTRYPFDGAHTTELGPALRRVLAADGGEPEMPKDQPGAVKGDDLAAILALADAWTRAHAPEAAPAGHDHHHHGGQ